METPHLAFVAEFVRELAAIDEIRVSASKELKQSPSDSQRFTSSIHASTLFQLELRSNIQMLRGMHLNNPFETLIPDLTALYDQQIQCHQKLIDISSAFLAGPKPGIDYAELATEVPKTRANLEFTGHTIFESSALVFGTLIDSKADSKDHLSHLIITRAERAKLIQDIRLRFGSRLDKKDQSYEVSAASVLLDLLTKGYKCSDDPWE